MRILNLDVDDLYLRASYKSVPTVSGRAKEVLSFLLGDRVHPTIPNEVLFGGVDGWNVSDTSDLYDRRYLAKSGNGVLEIWDMGKRRRSKGNLLFTGNYSVDGRYLIAPTYLRYGHSFSLNGIKVLAAGLKPTPRGGTALNMVLEVPPEVDYEVNGVRYSCSTGDLVNRLLIHSVDTQSLLGMYASV